MRATFTVAGRELRAWLGSPSAYVLGAAYLALCAASFVGGLHAAEGHFEQVESVLARAAVLWLPLLVAGVAMRGFAEERRNGTLELLLSLPVGERQLVLGKYVGSLGVVLLLAAANGLTLAVARKLSPEWPGLDAGCVAGAAGIMALLASLAVALGLLVSLLVRDPTLAAAGALALLWVPLLAARGWLGAGGVGGAEALLGGPVAEFAAGLVDTRVVLLALSSTGFVLFVCVRVLESLRWR